MFQEVCGRETASGGDTRMLTFADHLHAQKPIEHYEEGNPPKGRIGPLIIHMIVIPFLL